MFTRGHIKRQFNNPYAMRIISSSQIVDVRYQHFSYYKKGDGSKPSPTKILLDLAVTLHALFDNLEAVLPEGFLTDVDAKTGSQVSRVGFTGAG